ncbi:MAG TPA: Na+/H+ antiporter, partial [Trebonia sp.]|nr:Na+/H+ antiporter [Trebonia sp.]
GFGERKTPKPFVAACDKFTYTENLAFAETDDDDVGDDEVGEDVADDGAAEPGEGGETAGLTGPAGAAAGTRPGTARAAKDAAAKPGQPRRATAAQLKGDTSLVSWLRNAMEAASDDDGWATLSSVGAILTKQRPDFDSRSYGYAKLSDLIEATTLFETERRAPADGKQAIIYLRDKRRRPVGRKAGGKAREARGPPGWAGRTGAWGRRMGEQQVFTLVVAIAVVVIVSRVIANRFDVPEPVILVILGLLASLIPQVPNFDLSPDLVLFLFLPPLVYNAAFFSAPRETRENAVPITALAFGATAVTILAVGWVTRLILPQIGWAAALAFAAAVAPTDAVAATSVLNRLGAPQRIVTIIEGESLINDGVALTAFGLAVEAMAHPFTLGHGVARLAEVVAGGVGYGLVVAVVIGRVRHHVRDPSIQVLISLITPFVAYVPAEELHVSGVLGTVVAGVYLGTRAEGMLPPASRAAGTVFWRTVVFLLESGLFVLLGLELRTVVDHLSRSYSVGWLAGAAAAEVAAVIGIRMAWELIVSPLIAFLPGRHSQYVRNPWRQRLVVGWGGMRGAISLAIALTLPLTAGTRPFTERPTLIFLAAVVVVVTLVGEGLTLAPLIEALGLGESEEQRRREAMARARVAEAGLARLDELAEAGEVDEDTASVYRQLFEMRLERVRAALGDTDGDGPPDHSGFRAELARAQRAKLAELYQAGKISDEIRRSIARTLDLQERRREGPAGLRARRERRCSREPCDS